MTLVPGLPSLGSKAPSRFNIRLLRLGFQVLCLFSSHPQLISGTPAPANSLGLVASTPVSKGMRSFSTKDNRIKTLSHSQPLWITMWPQASAQTHSRANTTDASALWGETGSQSLLLCSIRPDSPKLQEAEGRPEKKKKKDWGNPESKTNYIPLKLSPSFVRKKALFLKLKHPHSSLFKWNNADGRFILSLPCSPATTCVTLVTRSLLHNIKYSPGEARPIDSWTIFVSIL